MQPGFELMGLKFSCVKRVRVENAIPDPIDCISTLQVLEGNVSFHGSHFLSMSFAVLKGLRGENYGTNTTLNRDLSNLRANEWMGSEPCF